MTQFEQTVVGAIADHDVIEDMNAEEGAGLYEPARQVIVIGARCRIATGMVVRLMCRRSLCGPGQWESPITRVDTLIAGT